ncbi:unannotated protein [freshwater metagenome]|uniref:Unannotated protein n=1 Tax=freshwater metagenome TaxID=449393 RepID=A0A6J6VQA4_9ZZZZ
MALGYGGGDVVSNGLAIGHNGHLITGWQAPGSQDLVGLGLRGGVIPIVHTHAMHYELQTTECIRCSLRFCFQTCHALALLARAIGFLSFGAHLIDFSQSPVNALTQGTGGCIAWISKR